MTDNDGKCYVQVMAAMCYDDDENQLQKKKNETKLRQIKTKWTRCNQTC